MVLYMILLSLTHVINITCVPTNLLFPSRCYNIYSKINNAVTSFDCSGEMNIKRNCEWPHVSKLDQIDVIE